MGLYILPVGLYILPVGLKIFNMWAFRIISLWENKGSTPN